MYWRVHLSGDREGCAETVGRLHDHLEEEERTEEELSQPEEPGSTGEDVMSHRRHQGGWREWWPGLHTHLWARGIGRAPASLVPHPALPVQLLAAVLLHSLQQQVVDGREVIVATALERLHYGQREKKQVEEPLTTRDKGYVTVT